MTNRKNKKFKSHKSKHKNNVYTSLDKLKNQSRTLSSPLKDLPGGSLMFRRWSDQCIPNILWACILRSHLNRDIALQFFRTVTTNAREKIEKYETTFITHNHMARLSDESFDTIFADVLHNADTKKLLSALLLVIDLPDLNHWKRHLTEPDTQEAGNILAHSVGLCFGHQSQEATDIRWAKLMHFIIMGRLIFPESMEEQMEELRLYPTKGNMRKVRPFIRAGEMSIRGIELGEEAVDESGLKVSLTHDDKFWKQMLLDTDCIIAEKRVPPESSDKEIKVELLELHNKVSNHFDTTLEHTGIDARHDSCFGLVLYALTLALNMGLGYSATLVEGRIILRTIMEAYATLHYLKYKDNETIWKQYRNYGAGNTKLAFLKNIKQDEVPEFIDIQRLEDLANEDMWLEFQDIPLGSWANSNLRQMAIDCGIKNTYDKYYDWASGYSHAHWVCVRDTTFEICMNPLHRFHRIPLVPKMDMPSALPDACKLVNLMLDDLNSLYPNFKPRIIRHKVDTRSSKK